MWEEKNQKIVYKMESTKTKTPDNSFVYCAMERWRNIQRINIQGGTLISLGGEGKVFLSALMEANPQGWDGIFGYLTSHEAYCLCVGNHSGHNLQPIHKWSYRCEIV